MELTIDKEIQSLIPPLAKDEREQLRANLVADGCRDALIAWKDNGSLILLDGHNRYELCNELGIGYRTDARDFPDRDAAMVWVIKNQFGRRNLNDFQRAELAVKLRDSLAAAADRRMKSGKATYPAPNLAQGRGLTHVRTVETVAKETGVSTGSLKSVELIRKSAVPEVADMARSGAVSIAAAAEVAKLPAEEQKQIASKGAKAVKERAVQQRKAKKAPKPKEAAATATEVVASSTVTDVIPTDEVGQRLPEDPKVHQAFAARADFDRALNELTRIKKLANSNAPGWEVAAERAQQFDNDHKNVRWAIDSWRPYAICPYCKGAGCKGCKGRKWVTLSVYEAAPREMKAAVAS